MSIFETITNRAPILKGWSEDKKYCVVTQDNRKYLLRISPIERFDARKNLFEVLKSVEKLGLLMSEPIELGDCDEGVYILFSWIDGLEAEEVIPRLKKDEQYAIGLKAGRILQKIHSIPAPKWQESWEKRFNSKTNNKIEKYKSCGIQFDGDDKIIDYIDQNRDLLKNRPQSFQHGDYHIGNMMFKSGEESLEDELVIIDFDRFDFGDPWEEFNRIVWCAQSSPHFASGIVDGYFDNQSPPIDFWRLLAFYIGSNALSSIYWAIRFGQAEVDIMIKQSQDILLWFDNMNSPVPTWYLGKDKYVL